MSEAELREGLRAAVGDEPPLDFDPDELIQRAQHVRRRRRALVTVAVVTVVLTGTALTLPGVLDRRSTVDAATGSVLTTTASPPLDPGSTAPPQPPSATVAAPPATAPAFASDDAGNHLTAYLVKRFPQVAPEVKVVRTDADPVTDPPPGHLYATVSFVDGVGTSRVTARIVPPRARMTTAEFCADLTCDDPVRRPDGSYLTSATTSDPTTATRTVAHFRLDGSVVEITAHGYEPEASGVVPTGVSLTTYQLVELATDPALVAP
ncbi:hypothetical protein ACIGNX_06945 [Actinosynnema sp. NPDC053489]|uniref:hypothetical protein n=1 Tax=Actinosynnema sp. NPDC053489 TaxID=3363916 RepID=UPI0037C91221